MRWRNEDRAEGSGEDEDLVEAVEMWKDPGEGSKKLSLVDLTMRAGRRLGSGGEFTRRDGPESWISKPGGQPDAEKTPRGEGLPQPCPTTQAEVSNLPLRVSGRTLSQSEALRGSGEGNSPVTAASDVGVSARLPKMAGLAEAIPAAGGGVEKRRETTIVINAAYLGPRRGGKAAGFNKPIVVDVELAVWDDGGGGGGGDGDDAWADVG